MRELIRSGGFSIVRRAYVWQTFENISGNQPRLIRVLRPMLRTLAALFEAIPGLRAFGVSQLIVARKPD
jgi:hypothetical protein